MRGGPGVSITTRPLTYQDLLRTPNDGRRYEIIGGQLVVSASPLLKHQKLSKRLADLLYDLEKAGLGEMYEAPTDVRLFPHEIVVPDLVFVTTARLGILTEALIDGAPDLVIEILSPSTSELDRGKKAALYAAAGVPEYWLVDPERRTILPQTLVAGAYEPIPISEGAVRSVVLPQLVVDVAALFAGIE